MVDDVDAPDNARSEVPVAVAELRRFGWAVCKPDPGEKKPTYRGWGTRSLEHADFAADDLVGILGGPLSDGNRTGHALVIVDLDAADAVARADEYLPATGMVEGRAGKPRSHRYYLLPFDTIPESARSRAQQAAPAAEASKGHPGPFKKSLRHSDSNAVVIDFIGTGGQCVCPPSCHPSGERREWDGGEPGDPAVVPFAELWTAVCRLAEACGCKPPSGVGWPWATAKKPSTRTRTGRSAGVSRRVFAYLAKCPPAVAGEGGHDRTFAVACALVWGFALGAEEAFDLLKAHYNPKCDPAWSDDELRHKLEGAASASGHDKPRGHLRDAKPEEIKLSLKEIRNGKRRDADNASEAEPATDTDPTGETKRGKKDFGASLFRDDDELDRLAELKVDDPAAFAAERAELKRRGVSMRDLDKALAPRVEELRAGRRAAAGVPTGVGDGPYFVKGGAVCRLALGRDGAVEMPLCNFDARIVSQTTRDDGAEQVRCFTVEGCHQSGQSLPPVDVPAEQFTTMNWVTARWGNRPVVYAGQGTKDHVRTAIQVLSGDVPERTVYGHTGWRDVGGKWVYLHAAGAIGADGSAEGVEVDLAGPLVNFTLPVWPAPDAMVPAVRASLGLILNRDRLAPDAVVVPLVAAVYRAALGEVDFALHLFGRTGVFKSELAALAQQHFGPALDARHLPANWMSTANANEGLLFAAKDAVVVVDDFNPTGAVDPQKLHAAADRLFRGLGNNAGRNRMSADLSLRTPRPPRGLVLSTGEDVPRGHSVRARVPVIEVCPGDVDLVRLTECQHDAANGQYATAMSGYLRWLAPRYAELRAGLPEERAAARSGFAVAAPHARTPGAVADLFIGLRTLVQFAQEVGAITPTEARAVMDRGRAALVALAAAQADHLLAADPVEQFLRLVPAVLASGEAHVATTDGSAPIPEALLGWRREGLDWRAGGERVGWADRDFVYLLPDAVFGAVQKLAAAGRDPITMSSRTLWSRLHERGLLAGLDTRGDRTRFTVRLTVAGERVPVLKFPRTVFFPAAASGPSGPPEDTQSGR